MNKSPGFDLSGPERYNIRVKRFWKKAALIITGCILPVYVSAQDASEQDEARSTVPELLRRPQRGEAPRYPRDSLIGELGRGGAGEEAYIFARGSLDAVVSGNRNSSFLSELEPAFLEGLITSLENIRPEKYHLGGGREEPDGGTSFLVRFIGREQSVAGELYLRMEGDAWRLEDLVLEEPRGIQEDAYYAPYERFF
jgi:hypothetical protein